MALTNQELQDILDGLTEDEQRLLFQQLGIKYDTIKPRDTETEEPVGMRPKTDRKVYRCPHCGSDDITKRGFTKKGLQRYGCKDCKKFFSENHGDSTRYSHLTEDEWKALMRGMVDNLSIPKMAQNLGLSTATVWLNRMKVNKAIMEMYGYSDLFRGVTEADEYYVRACFKGKRDPGFFIYTLGRMPLTHRSLAGKIKYLEDAGFYDRLEREEPGRLEHLLHDDCRKRGISNEQICILTLVDHTGRLYIEPVSVGRLEKNMAKLKLKPKYAADKDNVLVTDGHQAYDRALYGTGVRHVVVQADRHTNGKYSLAKVNSIHSELSRFMDATAGRVYNKIFRPQPHAVLVAV